MSDAKDCDDDLAQSLLVANQFCKRNSCREIRDDCLQESFLAMMHCRAKGNSNRPYLNTAARRACRRLWVEWRYWMSQEAFRWRSTRDKTIPPPVTGCDLWNGIVDPTEESSDDGKSQRVDELRRLADAAYLNQTQRLAFDMAVEGESIGNIADATDSRGKNRLPNRWQMLATVSKKLKAAMEGKPIRKGGFAGGKT
jgi:hypothetical protein